MARRSNRSRSRRSASPASRSAARAWGTSCRCSGRSSSWE
jgi:hypothetical protein